MKENKKYVGIFGGSFNPPHKGHTGLALEVLGACPEITEIWFMVASQNPLKNGYGVSFKDRFEMTKLACSVDPRLVPCDLEASMKSTYTYEVLRELRKTWPDINFVLIIGADNYRSFGSWREYEEILCHHPVYVYNRTKQPGESGILVCSRGFKFITEVKEFNISSSEIRLGRFSTEYLEQGVIDYIRDSGLYPYDTPPQNP